MLNFISLFTSLSHVTKRIKKLKRKLWKPTTDFGISPIFPNLTFCTTSKMCNTTLTKYLLFTFNLLFWLIGVFLLAIGVWAQADENFVNVVRKARDPWHSDSGHLENWTKISHERCERTSERMSEWPSTYISISRSTESLWMFGNFSSSRDLWNDFHCRSHFSRFCELVAKIKNRQRTLRVSIYSRLLLRRIK